MAWSGSRGETCAERASSCSSSSWSTWWRPASWTRTRGLSQWRGRHARPPRSTAEGRLDVDEARATHLGSERVVPLTIWVGVKDVMHALGCSRSTAYEHLRRASGRSSGRRGLLRVEANVWERYAKEVFGCGSTSEVALGGALSTSMAGASTGQPVATIAS